jgi:hypothetical protein
LGRKAGETVKAVETVTETKVAETKPVRKRTATKTAAE